jgi:hypothetical protein
LAKGTELIAYQITFLYKEVQILCKANKALAKCRRAKKIYIQAGGILSVGDVLSLIKQKDAVQQQSSRRLAEKGIVQAGPSGLQYCRRYSKTGYNIQTCQEAEEMSEEDSNVESN